MEKAYSENCGEARKMPNEYKHFWAVYDVVNEIFDDQYQDNEMLQKFRARFNLAMKVFGEGREIGGHYLFRVETADGEDKEFFNVSLDSTALECSGHGQGDEYCDEKFIDWSFKLPRAGKCESNIEADKLRDAINFYKTYDTGLEITGPEPYQYKEEAKPWEPPDFTSETECERARKEIADDIYDEPKDLRGQEGYHKDGFHYGK